MRDKDYLRELCDYTLITCLKTNFFEIPHYAYSKRYGQVKRT